MKAGGALLILELNSVGAAYEVIQGADAAGVESVELISSVSASVVLLSGEEATLKAVAARFSNAKSKILSNVPEGVIEAYLGLQSPPLTKSFLCFEGPRIAHVFEAACRLHGAGFLPFDLRVLRGGNELKATLLCQGAGTRPDLKDLTGTLTFIESPSTSLKNFFQIGSN